MSQLSWVLVIFMFEIDFIAMESSTKAISLLH